MTARGLISAGAGAACGAGSSDKVGAIAARLSETGSGAVDSRLTSVVRLTVIRSGLRTRGVENANCIASMTASRMCRTIATARPTLSSFSIPADIARSPITATRYGMETEPSVTNDIEVKPARPNSPITAITRP